MYPFFELKDFNSFAISAKAKTISTAESIKFLYQQCLYAKNNQLPSLILGEGSNVLFTEDFDGMVILNRIKGIHISNQFKYWHVYAASGENWHHFIEFLMNNKIYGAENLALIPGCVGSAPIQNIGAYGLELKDLCEYVNVLELSTGYILKIQAKSCRFSYRDSIFKHEYQRTHVIIGVGFKFAKQWSPRLTYDELALFNPKTVTPQQIFDFVCNIRRKKLPDPIITGNAGSFFKNPVISKNKAEKIKKIYPKYFPQYHQVNSGVKLAAGALIDQCGLKGFKIGDAAVHMHQASIIINQNRATGSDVVKLAKHVSQTVAKYFNVVLEPEVRFIDRYGEMNPMDCML
ncbi:UDP-N-acetylenolpyruvoylglucosamine reductase [Candidatus Hartigia pinicola]|nr:UDP-N-acetylenolpyruvoylglucosamine reductase [Candidatus Hartigia pinicola]